MRGLLLKICLLMLSSLPVVAVETAPASPAHGVKSPCDICHALLEEAQQVNLILRSVSDRESADKAADALHVRLKKMKELCHQLEVYPIDDVRELTTSMRSLTHIIQSGLPVIHRLQEVNSYGSEKLVQVFHLYRMPTSLHAVYSEEDAVDVALYLEWGDALEDVAYYLGRIKNETDLAGIADQLPRLTESVESSRKRVEAQQLQDNRQSREISEQLKPAVERCHAIRRIIQAEQKRLAEAGLLRPKLDEMLRRILK